MHSRKYEILLAAVVAARATSFIFSKMVLQSMGMFNLLAVRFLLAFAVLVVIFFKRLIKISLRDFISGMACGAAFFCVMTCEYTALKTSSSSLVSLLENCAIIFVPVLELLLFHKLPKKLTVLSALGASLGVFLLTAQNGGFSGGVLFGLLAAMLYAGGIILTSVVSPKAADPLCIGIIQVGTLGLLALAATFLFEQPHLPDQLPQWLMIIVLAVVCTCFGYTLQPVAQRYVSAEKTGLLCSINPAVAAILGAVVLHEKFGLLSIAGLLLILLSIMLPHIKTHKASEGCGVVSSSGVPHEKHEEK